MKKKENWWKMASKPIRLERRCSKLPTLAPAGLAGPARACGAAAREHVGMRKEEASSRVVGDEGVE